MPNKTKTKASKKPAAKTPVKKAAAHAAKAKAKAAKPLAAKAKPVEKKPAKPTAADRAAAKAALKAQKKLLKIEKARTKLEAKIAAKALAKEAKLALKRKMREAAEGVLPEGNGAKGKGLNLLVAPKGKLKGDKPGRKVKAPKPTKGPQFPPGTVFLPDGFKSREEIQYLFRGAVACVRESHQPGRAGDGTHAGRAGRARTRQRERLAGEVLR